MLAYPFALALQAPPVPLLAVLLPLLAAPLAAASSTFVGFPSGFVACSPAPLPLWAAPLAAALRLYVQGGSPEKYLFRVRRRRAQNACNVCVRALCIGL